MVAPLSNGSFELLCPEARVLLAAIRPAGDSAAVAAVLGDPSLDWERLFALAMHEKAVAALAELVDRTPEGSVPPPARARLAALTRVTQFRMLRLQQLLINALDVLAARDIEVVLLKGAGLAATVYGSFVARPMYDLDLLVRQDQAAAAWEALRAAGWVHDVTEFPGERYGEHHHFPPLADPADTGLLLELHTSPAATGAIDLSGEAMRRDARVAEIQGRRAYVPAPEHQVLHLAVHFAWSHGLARASWRSFRDLQQILTHAPLDWDAVVDAAREARATTSCYWTFRLARSLAHVAVPTDVLRRLRPPRPVRVLDLLERHYTVSLFPANPAPCPSVRVTQMLWSAGMAPRWSGHGSVRPWKIGEAWVEATAADGRPSPIARFVRHVEGAGRWASYLAALFRAGNRDGSHR